MDCARWRSADAAALPPEAAQDLEEVSDEDLHRGPGRGQLHSDEERLEAISLSIKVSCCSTSPNLLFIAKLLTRFSTYTEKYDTRF